MIPPLEHDPHLRAIRWIRTTRGTTLMRRAQPSTRRRSRSLSSILIFGVIEQNGKNDIDDPTTLAGVESE